MSSDPCIGLPGANMGAKQGHEGRNQRPLLQRVNSLALPSRMTMHALLSFREALGQLVPPDVTSRL
jgi:hypothetical protein